MSLPVTKHKTSFFWPTAVEMPSCKVPLKNMTLRGGQKLSLMDGQESRAGGRRWIEVTKVEGGGQREAAISTPGSFLGGFVSPPPTKLHLPQLPSLCPGRWRILLLHETPSYFDLQQCSALSSEIAPFHKVETKGSHAAEDHWPSSSSGRASPYLAPNLSRIESLCEPMRFVQVA